MNNGDSELRSDRDAARNTATGLVLGMMVGGLIDTFGGDLGIASILGMVVGALLGYFGLHRLHLMEYPPGALIKIAISLFLLIVVLFGTVYFLEQGVSDPLDKILPLAPAVPAFLVILSLGQAIASLDEMQRRIQLEAIATGFGIAAVVSLTYGLFGMRGVPQPSWIFVPVLLVFSWLIGKIWIRWKYR